MTTCERCQSGPSGLEGHDSLNYEPDGRRYGEGHGHHLFVCMGCGSLWTRRYDGGGVFQWLRATVG